jgi:hypothetical protein
MIGRKGLEARVRRLEELGVGLMKEVRLWEPMPWTGKATPIPTTELQQYLGAVRRAIEAIAEARGLFRRLSRSRQAVAVRRLTSATPGVPAAVCRYHRGRLWITELTFLINWI